MKRFLRIDVVPTAISPESSWQQKVDFLDELEFVMVNEVAVVDNEEIKTISEVKTLSFDASKATEAIFTVMEG